MNPQDHSKSTPGPWIAASHQSHIVGIPIVGPDGRSIGFAATLAGITPEGQEFNARSLANAQLMASAPVLATRLAEAERLIADTRPCVESWKHKHERAYKAAQRHERPCHAQWHAENVITATALLARIDAWCAASADGAT